MDAQERAALETILEVSLAQREELDVVIRHISGRLGLPAPTGPGGSSNLGNGVAPNLNHAGVDPVDNTAEGEYYGFNSTDAAFAVLTKFGSRQHALKTKTLYDAIKKGGVSISTEDGLYRSLARSHRFRKVGRGLWGLSEWYPAAPRATRKGPDMTNVSSLDGAEIDETAEQDADTEVQTA